MLLTLKVLGGGFCYEADESGGGGTGNPVGSGGEPQTPPAPTDEKPNGTTPEPDELEKLIKLIEADPKKTAAEIKKLRQEAANANDNQRELKKKLKEFEAAQQKKLEEQGDFQKLYEQAKPELERLKAEEEAFKAYRQAFEKMFKVRMKDVPGHIKDLLADKDPLAAMAWLEANADKLKPPPEPDLDGGRRDRQRGDDYVGSPEHLAKAASRLRIPLVFSKPKQGG